jgi:citrate lyase beta subunit
MEFKRMQRPTQIKRSLLFVPGAEQRKLERSRDATADLVVFDLEDSVVPDLKSQAREQVADHIRSVKPGDLNMAVRVNPPETAHFEADLDAVVSAGIQTIMLPKSESVEGLSQASASAAAIEAKLDLDPGSIRLLALVETATGISRVETLPEADSRIDALCFGNADFSLDMGLPEPDPATGVLLHARCRLAIAAAAAKVAPIDGVCLAVKDTAAFLEEGNLALRLGFEGKLCIHPAQVEIANSIFTPTEAQIETALRVIEGWDAAVADGKGVFALDGKMIDPPLVYIHQRVIDRAKLAGVLERA